MSLRQRLERQLEREPVSTVEQIDSALRDAALKNPAVALAAAERGMVVPAGASAVLASFDSLLRRQQQECTSATALCEQLKAEVSNVARDVLVKSPGDSLEYAIQHSEPARLRLEQVFPVLEAAPEGAP